MWDTSASNHGFEHRLNHSRFIHFCANHFPVESLPVESFRLFWSNHWRYAPPLCPQWRHVVAGCWAGNPAPGLRIRFADGEPRSGCSAVRARRPESPFPRGFRALRIPTRLGALSSASRGCNLPGNRPQLVRAPAVIIGAAVHRRRTWHPPSFAVPIAVPRIDESSWMCRACVLPVAKNSRISVFR